MSAARTTRFLLIGGASIDLYADTNDVQSIRTDSPRPQTLACLPTGSKTTLSGLHAHAGGSAANAAVALTQLGSDARLLAAVADDALGSMLLSGLRHHGIRTSDVIVLPHAKTGVSIVLRCKGEKTLLAFRGANDRLSAQSLSPKYVSQANALVLTSLPSKPNFALFKKAITLARKHHVKVVFAPSNAMISSRKKELMRMHEHFDVAIMNAQEAANYTGENKVKEALKRLPGKVRVVMDAGNGAHLHVGGSSYHIPAPKVSIVDTTGAGDAFTAGFCHEYYRHAPLLHASKDTVHAAVSALRFASAVAGIKLRQVGAHFTHSASEVHAFLKMHPELSVKKK